MTNERSAPAVGSTAGGSADESKSDSEGTQLDGGNATTLEQMTARHRAIARYRVYHFDPTKPKGRQKTYVYGADHLTWEEAPARVKELNDAVFMGRPMKFADASYGYELENTWATLSPAARARLKLLGKGEDL